jgi:hypothetical protein
MMLFMRTLPQSFDQKKTAQQHTHRRVRFGGIAIARAARTAGASRWLQRLCHLSAPRSYTMCLKRLAELERCSGRRDRLSNESIRGNRAAICTSIVQEKVGDCA